MLPSIRLETYCLYVRGSTRLPLGSQPVCTYPLLYWPLTCFIALFFEHIHICSLLYVPRSFYHNDYNLRVTHWARQPGDMN